MGKRGWEEDELPSRGKVEKRVAVGLDWFAEELVVSLLFREQEIRERN